MYLNAPEIHNFYFFLDNNNKQIFTSLILLKIITLQIQFDMFSQNIFNMHLCKYINFFLSSKRVSWNKLISCSKKNYISSSLICTASLKPGDHFHGYVTNYIHDMRYFVSRNVGCKWFDAWKMNGSVISYIKMNTIVIYL